MFYFSPHACLPASLLASASTTRRRAAWTSLACTHTLRCTGLSTRTPKTGLLPTPLIEAPSRRGRGQGLRLGLSGTRKGRSFLLVSLVERASILHSSPWQQQICQVTYRAVLAVTFVSSVYLVVGGISHRSSSHGLCFYDFLGRGWGWGAGRGRGGGCQTLN